MSRRVAPRLVPLVLAWVLAAACAPPEQPPFPVEEPARPLPPGAPRVVSAVRGDRQVEVTWTAPVSDGGRPVLGYLVTAHPQGTQVRGEALARSARVTGLTNGQASTFTVRALNAVGEGPDSEASASVVPARVPSVVREVSAVAGVRELTVTWTEPEETGGLPVAEYGVTVEPGGHVLRPDASARGATVTGLSNGTEYTVRVVARNEVGEGLAASAAPQRTLDVPGAPGIVSTVRGDRQVEVTWTAPASDGGRPVEHYVVSASPRGLEVTVGREARSAVVKGLVNGEAATFRVRAHNSVGPGVDSPSSESVTPATVPSPPRAVTVRAGVREATVSWEAPSEDGGSPITGYRVEIQPTGTLRDVGAGAREVTVTELPSTQRYTVTVSALNSVGLDSAASPAPVRPRPTPARVPVLDAPGSASSGCVPLTYTLAQDDGERADVLVEVDTQGLGTFRPATQAGSTDHEGTLALATSSGGTAHRFLWNRTRDARGATSVQVRVSARVAGVPAGSRTLTVPLSAPSQDCESSLDSALVSLFPATHFRAQPVAATAGDFDQDGKRDLVVLIGSGEFLLMKGLGNGRFLPGSPLTLGVLGSVDLPPAAADLDGDGAVDLLWVESNRALSVARGLGNGSFAPPQRYSTAAGLWLADDKPGLAVADFNGDERLDVAMNSSRGPGLFLNAGNGTFGAFQPLNVPSAPARVADLDGDGRQDLVLPRPGSPAGTVLLSNGDGTFRGRTTDLPVDSLVLKDFDGNGLPDALYSSGTGVFLRLGDGQGGFGAAIRVAESQSEEMSSVASGNLTAGDLDGDGLTDFALAVTRDRTSHLLLLWKGRGSAPFFLPEVVLPVPRFSSFLTQEDFTGDAIADLLTLQNRSQWTEWDRRDVRVWPGGAERLARSLPEAPPGAIATGDLNADGWEDLLFADTSDFLNRLLRVRLGGPTGLSAPRTVFTLPDFVNALDVVRVDADAKLDVVLHSGGTKAILLLGNGDGTLRRGTDLTLDATEHVESGDVNRDGKPDLVFTAWNSNRSARETRLRLGRGDGTFDAPLVLSDLASAEPPALGDLDGDGALDVVLLRDGGDVGAKVLLGRGDGSFTPGPALALPPSSSVRALQLADMNRDGIADAVYCQNLSATQGSLQVLQGTGTGAFQPASTVSTAAYCTRLLVVDLDGDGWRDVLAGSWNSDSVSVWRGQGQGQLAPEQSFGTYLHDPGVVHSLAVLDANGDGRRDVLAGHGLRVNTLLLQR